ncbi:MAG: HEPN domain-containing protein [Candidatus Omnitrophota bacterium]|nr:HEPN domain-containing protein [Candidatus Omnitrophota bacterium]
MTYKRFVEEYLSKGLLKEQKANVSAIEKIAIRAERDSMTANANLAIDEAIAYTTAYLAMLRMARAFMLFKGFRPSDGSQHKTAVEFMTFFLSEESKVLAEHFDRMRRKRNIFTCDIDISISKTEAENAIGIASKFLCAIKELIKKENPQIEFKF